MGLQLFFSHRLEDLGVALAERLRAQGSGPGAEAQLFQPTTIVYPNLNLKKWLQLTIARHNGVAALLEFHSLEEEIQGLLLGRDSAATSTGVLNLTEIGWLVARALMEAPVAETAALAPLRKYIGWEPTERTGLTRRQAAKAWQLAGKLARLLRDYEIHRPDWIAAWRQMPVSAAIPGNTRAGRGLPTGALAEAEQTLYRRIFDAGGLRDQWQQAAGMSWRTLPQWAAAADRQADAADVADVAVTLERPVHIFSLPQMSLFYRQMIFQMAARREVNLYLLNLGAIAWSQQPATAESGWFAVPAVRLSAPNEIWEGMDVQPTAADAAAAADAVTVSAVRLWNRVGLEGLQILQQGAGAAGEAGGATGAGGSQKPIATRVHWLAHGRLLTPGSSGAAGAAGAGGSAGAVAPGLLGRVQQRLLNGVAEWNAGTVDSAELQTPATVQVARCPSLQREVEAVYQCILHNLTRQPDLRQSDILVLVPDMAQYRAAIHAAFDRGEGLLGYNLSDLSGADDSLYAQAVQSALHLSEGRFTRAEVFEFLQNPCVAAALEVDRARLMRWGQWADQLHVFAGEGPAGDAQAFTWRQALIRLQLGRVMEAPPPRPDEEDEATPADFGGWIPYADAETADSEELNSFVEALELLEAGIGRLRGRSGDGLGWLGALQQFLDRFVAVPPAHPGEAQVQAQVRSDCGHLAQALREQALAGWAMPPRAVVREAVLEALTAIPSRQGRYLAGGVTLSTQFPLRPIPFRVIFVLGLDEHAFALGSARPAIDLRNVGRRVGDTDEGDLQRMMFLEAVLSARERLYCSYVHRDLQKDELRLPCALLTQLIEFARPLTVDGCVPAVTVPLHSHARGYFEGGGLAREPGDSAAPSDFEHNYSAADRRLAEAERAREAGISSGAGLADAASAPVLLQKLAPAAATELAAEDLARFLRRPLATALARHIGVDDFEDEDVEVLEADTEPFFLTAAIERRVERQALNGLLQGQSRADAAAGALAQLAVQRRLGATPVGGFQARETARLKGRLEQELWGGAQGRLPAAILALADLPRRRRVIFGDAQRVGAQAERYGPVPVAGAGGDVGGGAGNVPVRRLHGSLAHLWYRAEARELTLLMPVAALQANRPGPPTELFAPLVVLAALRAAQAQPAAAIAGLPSDDALRQFEKVTALALYHDRLVTYRWQVSPAAAAAGLQSLIGEMLTPGDYPYLAWDMYSRHWSDLQRWHADGGVAAAEAQAFRAALARELNPQEEAEFGPRPPTVVERIAGVRLPADPAAVLLRRLDLLLRLQDGAPAAGLTPVSATSAKGGGGGKRKTKKA